MSEEKLKTLIGDDGDLYTGVLGEELSGDGTKTIAGLAAATKNSWERYFCLITAKTATASIFPDGLKAGEMFPALGTEVPAVGDKFRLLTMTECADLGSWKLEFTQETVDVTKLRDKTKKYRPGKSDAKGSAKTIFTQGVSDESGASVGRTMKVFKRDAAGKVTVTDQANEALYFIGYCNKAECVGERSDYVFAKIYMYNLSLGGDAGSAQSYDSSFTLVDLDPVFYNDETPQV